MTTRRYRFTEEKGFSIIEDNRRLCSEMRELTAERHGRPRKRAAETEIRQLGRRIERRNGGRSDGKPRRQPIKAQSQQTIAELTNALH